jgi:hypothetical protein
VLTSPLHTSESNGKLTNLSLVDRRDLFHSDAMFGYGDLVARYVQEDSWSNLGLQNIFVSREAYLKSLSTFWFVTVFIHNARHPEYESLYPAFKLLPGGVAGIKESISRLSHNISMIELLASLVPEDIRSFKENWSARITRINEADLGPRYRVRDWDDLPTTLEWPH